MELLRYRPDIELTADQLYDLVLAVTDDPEQAEKAWGRHRWAELKSGRTPR